MTLTPREVELLQLCSSTIRMTVGSDASPLCIMMPGINNGADLVRAEEELLALFDRIDAVTPG